MCGIAGVFNFRAADHVAEDTLQAMLRSIHHRGPDDSGLIVDRECGLGMTRLEIIDLVTGAQPMVSKDGRFTIVYNGEIYNYQDLRRDLSRKGYRFETTSDTEVILAMKVTGDRHLEAKLRGMFAIAIFDHQLRILELWRDRMGKKPLFWAETPRGIVFGSEIKAILASGAVKAEVNGRAISEFLTLGYTPGPHTPIKGVMELPPSCKMTVSDSIKVEKYWKLATPTEESKYETSVGQHLEEELLENLRDSIRCRLVSDVEVGVFLSGGIDSSLILSLALDENHGEKLKTYTVGFESPSYDESNVASLVAKRLGVENKMILLTPDHIRENFGRIVYHSDNLLANPAIYPNYLLSLFASREIKVALSGVGGDELFYGYPTFRADVMARAFSRFPASMLSPMLKSVNLLPTSHKKLSFAYKARKFAEGMGLHGDKAHYWWRTIITEAEKPSLLPAEFLETDAYSSYEAFYSEFDGSDYLEKYAYADIWVWLRAMGLYQADAMSMANSLELRVPMVDHKLVEFAFQIPRGKKFRFSQTKPLLKKVAKGIIPSELLRIKKAGLHVPLAEWFCGSLKDFVLAKLSDDRVGNVGFLNIQGVKTVLAEHFSRKCDNSYKINNLLVLVEWYHQFILGETTGLARPS